MMFEGPEHASYVELCRALRLEREFEWGDWMWFEGQFRDHNPWGYLDLAEKVCDPDGRREDTYDLDLKAGDQPGPGDGYRYVRYIWLPRLDQWLAMLEEAGQGDEWLLYQEGLMPDGSGLKRYCAEFEHGTTKAASTPEEACARLWLAVIGREAPRAETR